MPVYVALDLETTGLDPEHDEIIEVGAVRFTEEGVLDTYQTFVNPRRPLSARIQRLTGIRPADLERAPSFGAVAREIEAFIGEEPVVGQNVRFDLDFLARRGVIVRGPAYDTRDLAALLLPHLRRHNLRTIVEELLIDFPVQHRALEDAKAAQKAFLLLRERLLEVEPELLAEAARLSASSDWGLRVLFHELRDNGNGRPSAAPRLAAPSVAPPKPAASELEPKPNPRPVTAQEVRELLETRAARVMEGFERREEQLAMAEAVRRALTDGERLVVEAGTGVGKSLAYLAPAALHAVRNGARVVISTNTINLQEQLVSNDIPLVRRLLEDAGVRGLRATQLKGRRNYLCLLRWTAASAPTRQQPLSADEARVLVKIAFWLPKTETGDVAELALTQGEDQIWNRLSAQEASCSSSNCPFVRDGSCFLVRARKRAEAAHLVVVNHALLLSDLRTDGALIPPYNHVIIDEAHHLESEATRQFGFEASEQRLLDLLDAVHVRVGRDRDGGLVGACRALTRGPLFGAGLSAALGPLADATGRARERLARFFAALPPFMREHIAGESDYDETLLITRAIRVQPAWADLEALWEDASAALGDVVSHLERLALALEDMKASGEADAVTLDALLTQASEALLEAEALRTGVDDIILRENHDLVCWLSVSRRTGAVSVASAPMRVSDILRERLFEAKESVVLTSATLSSDGHFQYLNDRLGLESPRELLLGSPFDYERSTLVLVPRDLPQPGDHGYQRAVEEALIDLCRASEGRALALFTSYAALRATYGAIRGPLEEDGILVLAHGIDGSPGQLIEQLRDHPRTVVLGTSSFWEGVDVVGEALSLLVIARLPFSVPTDPIFQARSTQYDDPFNEYAVPQAVLRFKQGFGRLIRRKTDRGVMVVLDQRALGKRYGATFLNSLPACRVREVSVRELAGATRSWLAQT
ncbi:MAG TPA: helicase C-terminal domain-containing protein [Dehalococcoidia bacterium]|nr:helicase C-terminal domain-containing protein [Dehalococcoidia bacterium]